MNPNSDGEKQIDSEWEESFEEESEEEAYEDDSEEESFEDDSEEEAYEDDSEEEAYEDDSEEEAYEDEPEEEAYEDDSGEEAYEADSEEEAYEDDSGEEVYEDDSGEEVYEADSEEESFEDDSEEEAYEDDSEEEAYEDDSEEEAYEDEPGEETYEADSEEEAYEDDSGEEAYEDDSGEEAYEDDSEEESFEDDSEEEAYEDEFEEEAYEDDSGEEAYEDENAVDLFALAAETKGIFDDADEEYDGDKTYADENNEDNAYPDEEGYVYPDELNEEDPEASTVGTEEENAVDLFRLAADAEEPDEDMVDLFAIANNRVSDLPEPQNHGAFYYWCKRKTAGGWVSFGVKCAGAAVLLVCLFAVLYFNGLLNLIDYRAADDFEQYYNLSDTDYHADNADVYSNPTNYNESTTIDGFDPSMIDIPKEDVVNILLIGTDVRNGTYEDRGNTDSMILLSVNTRDKNIKLTSFMRDMYVDIPGREWQRLNAAYAYGGPQLLFDTLERNFDVDVDMYVRVNFANFRKIIDKVGGVNIELTEAEARYMNKYSKKYKTNPVEPGMQRLDGAQALSYARCRKIDSDFNRTGRQRKVILAVVNEIKHCNVMELNSLLNTILPMIQTNMSKMQILNLMADSVNYLNNDIETLNVPIKNSWQSATIRKMSVICPNFALNKTAILAHVYSTYRLDVDGTRYQNFDVPGSEKTTKTTQNTQITQTILPTETPSTSAAAETTETTATTETAAPTEKTQESQESQATRETEATVPTETAAPTRTEKTTADAEPEQEQKESDEAVG